MSDLPDQDDLRLAGQATLETLDHPLGVGPVAPAASQSKARSSRRILCLLAEEFRSFRALAPPLPGCCLPAPDSRGDLGVAAASTSRMKTTAAPGRETQQVLYIRW